MGDWRSGRCVHLDQFAYRGQLTETSPPVSVPTLAKGDAGFRKCDFCKQQRIELFAFIFG